MESQSGVTTSLSATRRHLVPAVDDPSERVGEQGPVGRREEVGVEVVSGARVMMQGEGVDS